MLHGRKIVVVMPAYNAERTLRRTVDEIPRDVVDALLLVDDASRDETAALAAFGWWARRRRVSAFPSRPTAA